MSIPWSCRGMATTRIRSDPAGGQHRSQTHQFTPAVRAISRDVAAKIAVYEGLQRPAVEQLRGRPIATQSQPHCSQRPYTRSPATNGPRAQRSTRQPFPFSATATSAGKLRAVQPQAAQTRGTPDLYTQTQKSTNCCAPQVAIDQVVEMKEDICSVPDGDVANPFAVPFSKMEPALLRLAVDWLTKCFGAEIHVTSEVQEFLDEACKALVFEVRDILSALIYLKRLRSSGRFLELSDIFPWKIILLGCIIIADKINEDRPAKTSEVQHYFSKVLGDTKLAYVERHLLIALRHQVWVDREKLTECAEQLLCYERKYHPIQCSRGVRARGNSMTSFQTTREEDESRRGRSEAITMDTPAKRIPIAEVASPEKSHKMPTSFDKGAYPSDAKSRGVCHSPSSQTLAPSVVPAVVQGEAVQKGVVENLEGMATISQKNRAAPTAGAGVRNSHCLAGNALQQSGSNAAVKAKGHVSAMVRIFDRGDSALQSTSSFRTCSEGSIRSGTQQWANGSLTKSQPIALISSNSVQACSPRAAAVRHVLR